ncbi:MAG: 50S ribosomal protein L32 [Rickettsiales bacterium]|nr:50S ribosomal protein L32 [Rickettsiales bacterium]|tara:strand:+ start:482 stop:670 length:189 start_codon:yes stop_codon:yes gene_type:complete
MAVPKKKISKSRRGQRRADSKMKIGTINVIENATTGEFHRPHHVSPDGYYKGRQVTDKSVNA